MATNIPYNVLKEELFSVNTENDFEKLALSIFRLQYEQNAVYRKYTNALGKTPASINKMTDIPFLPVTFFKTHEVVCGDKDNVIARDEAICFYSSSTSSGIPSKHIVKDSLLYTQSFRKCFAQFYGDIKDYCILTLLPSYLERTGSSLVLMAEDMVKQSGNPYSGFYLHNMPELKGRIELLERKEQKTILLGVTYALLDFAEKHPMKLNHTIVMETGGMKGKRKEMPRSEVHSHLKKAFGLAKVHSEYGMTELLSQAYSSGDGVFKSPPWMRIMIRDMYDPLQVGIKKQTGGINIIDLANLNSCSFIATDDTGIVNDDGSFEVTGRIDLSDIRGCNLMAEEL